MKKILNGFTLIELLVVIAIMAILGAAVFLNSKSSAQEQAVKKAVGEIQSYLRLAQSNATTSLKCADQTGSKVVPKNWYLEFSDRTSVHLKCDSNTASDQKLLPLDSNIEIDSIYNPGSPTCNSSFNSTAVGTIQVYFTALYGQVSFIDALNSHDSCFSGSSLSIKLRHKINTSLFKTITISKGGNIDAP